MIKGLTTTKKVQICETVQLKSANTSAMDSSLSTTSQFRNPSQHTGGFILSDSVTN